MRRLNLFVALIVLAAILVPGQASAERAADASDILRQAVTLEGLRGHQAEFQAIADATGGVRSGGTPGYDMSADYVQETMEAAGYDVERLEFEFDYFEVVGDPIFEQTAPTAATYVDQEDYDVMTFSGSGTAAAAVTAVDLALDDRAASTSGCEPEDFDGFPAGDIALVQRGACSFAAKATNAEAAGAVGVVIFNQGNTPDREGLLFGTLGGPGSTIPVLGTTFAVGEALAVDGAAASITTETISEARLTTNVIAQSKTGGTDDITFVGAHLDSVPEGPGIQDNGTGSAALLEMAIQLQEKFDVNSAGDDSLVNAVRFGWWGAEEFGLLGSIDYVQSLTPEELAEIGVYLNFDMIGSPNFVRFVYDGDSSDAPATIAVPPQSATVEDVFLDYFDSQGLPTEATVIGQRSDHFAFCVSGIPCGGLFTGAEVIKTPEQVEIYGGTAGQQYDPCYHLVCDTFDNISLTAFDQMSDAAAHALAVYAFTPLCNGLPATIIGTDGDDEIRGTGGDDVIAALGGADKVSGGGGDDVICLGDGDDEATGGAGDDTIFGDGDQDKISGGTGADTLSGGDGEDEIRGDDGADTLTGDAGRDKLFGGADDDTIDGGDERDEIEGGNGDDTLTGGAEDDEIDGGNGTDTIDGGDGEDKILGGNGDDVIGGGAGDDEIEAGRGDDSVDGGEGFDEIDGGRGEDVCVNGEDLAGCESTTALPAEATQALADAAAAAGGGGGGASASEAGGAGAGGGGAGGLSPDHGHNHNDGHVKAVAE